ncbi:MAG: guanylate kinase [Desulfobacca sp.]|uniref:guanylate kinase n=1 Tax=Desulfobacca sp. TaxID=2067990 RepID=UPI004049E833
MAAQIFVISGASGAGKTTLVRALQAGDPSLRFAVSYTTRPPRPGEVDGQDYCFISETEFLQLIRAGLVVEYVHQFGYYYGTSRTWLDQALKGHRDILFDVEIHGARALKEHCPQGTFIFILPPTPHVLESRLRQRGNLPEAELQARLARVRQEVREAPWYDYLVVNDELPQATARLQAIVTAARCRSHTLWPTLSPFWE